MFEVPTTLEALHDMISTYASTGADASLIVQRIHAANSVRLDRRNAEKMQNFYDVVLRRFIAVGDAISTSGDGGPELGRFQQLNELTKIMYKMAQDAPESAAAVWGRRIGVFQNAHAKRLRDAELEHDEEEEENFTAWPSTGVVLALRSLPHIFPVTDQRHHVVTPALLMLAQMVAQTPILSRSDLVIALFCTGLMVEYTKEAKRVVPEALAFLSSIIRLYAPDLSKQTFAVPSVAAASELDEFAGLRTLASEYKKVESPRLSLDKPNIEGPEFPAAALYFALHLAEISVQTLHGSLEQAELEAFSELSEALLSLHPHRKTYPLPECLTTKISSVASALSLMEQKRRPLMRRQAPSVVERAIPSLAPRMDDIERYHHNRDKNKNATQAALDRTRREYKREHKAVARELRLDSAFAERERRDEYDRLDSARKAKRHKAYVWLEQEQATMNQQVAQGGGLLKGGGTGAARAKAATAKLGIKKGGKFKS